MLNRAALLVRYKQPFVDWINQADPRPTHTVTLADLEQDRTVYLVEGVEDEEGFEIWVRTRLILRFPEMDWKPMPSRK